MTLIVEDGTGLSTANSYATVAEADAYHQSRLHTSTWDAAYSTDKEAALIWASRLLDEHTNWCGTPATSTQALCWPRSSTYSKIGVLLSSTAIPADVKNATSELARRLLASDRPQSSEEGTVTSKSVGPLSISYAGSRSSAAVPDSVSWMVRHLIAPRMAMRA